MKRRIVKGDHCLNCGKELHDENFCPDCGQLNNIAKPTFGQLIMDALANLFAFDSKFYLSIWPLMRYPGRLSLELVSGKKATYLPPIRLFLLVVIITLGLNSISNRIERGFNDVSHLRKDTEKPDKISDITNAKGSALETFVQNANTGLSDSVDVGKLKEMIDFAKANPQISRDSALVLLNYAPTTLNKKFYDYTIKNLDQLAPLSNLSSDNANKNNINVDGKYETKFGKMYKYAAVNPDATPDSALAALNIPVNFWNRFYYSYALKLTLMSLSEFFNYIKSNLLIILLLFVPIMALILKMLYFYKSEYYYVDHFIFSIHTQTAFFVIIALSILLNMLLGTEGFFWVLLVFPFYLFLALKNFYKQRKLATFINYLIINTTFFFVAGIFLFLVGLVSFLLY